MSKIEWRPIEEARKDGTRYLLASQGGILGMGKWVPEIRFPNGVQAERAKWDVEVRGLVTEEPTRFLDVEAIGRPKMESNIVDSLHFQAPDEYGLPSPKAVTFTLFRNREILVSGADHDLDDERAQGFVIETDFLLNKDESIQLRDWIITNLPLEVED